MYIDVIALAIILVLVILFFKRFSSFVFSIAIIDIFLRIIAFIKYNLPSNDFTELFKKHIPDNIFSIIDNYTKGIINTGLKWLFVITMCFFWFYIVKIFIKRKKI